MRHRSALAALLLVAGPAAADPVSDVESVARGWLAALPAVETVEAIAGRCGADETTAPEGVAYCTGANVIFVTPEARDRDDAAALVAHLYGHAMQVRLGVADVALSTIRANRDREIALRRDVERMVWCLAGHLAAAAGHGALPPWDDEPLTGSHWGANLGRGPQVSIGLTDVETWFRRGADEGLDACDTESFPATLVRDGLGG